MSRKLKVKERIAELLEAGAVEDLHPTPAKILDRAIAELVLVKMAPQMYRTRDWLASLGKSRWPHSPVTKQKVWKLVWHYRNQIKDRKLVAHAAKRLGNMAELMILLEDCE